MTVALSLAAAVLLSFAVSAAIMPVIIAVSHKRSWYDIPNDRKIHSGPIPRLGGMGIYVGFIIAAIVVPLLLPVVFPREAPRASFGVNAILLFLSFTLIHGMGLVDDFHNLRALLKFILQIVAAILATAGGLLISSVTIPGWGRLSFGLFSYPLTVLWLVAVSNAINLMDGVDGLAGGIAAIAALALAAQSLFVGSLVPAIIAFALAGALVGFLLSNAPPARIFMGDSGSLLIGFVLAALPLMVSPGQTSINNLLAPVTVLLIPILDMIFAMARRIREGRPIYSPDRKHLHHKLLDLGVGPLRLLLILYGVSIILGIVAVASLSMSRWVGFSLVIVTWLVVCACFLALGSLQHRKVREATGTQSSSR